MGCPCENNVVLTSTNCGGCGYLCTNCICPTNPMEMPVVVCEDPEPCDELFPLECLLYTGLDIKCSSEADLLYPNSIHYVVLGESTVEERKFSSILRNINSQLCYIFSKNYISQLLTNINADAELKALFCNITASCNCTCTITCPSVISATYNSSSVSTDTITVNFNQSLGGSTPITFTGSISGTTLTVSSVPVGTIVVGQKITGSTIAANTFIIANLSGSGSGSTWTVNVSQTAASTAITAVKRSYTVAIYRLVSGNTYQYVDSITNSSVFGNITYSGLTATGTVSVSSTYDNTGNQNWMVSVLASDVTAIDSCFIGYLNSSTTSNYSAISSNCGVGLYTAPTALICRMPCSTNINAAPTFGSTGGGVLTFSFTTEVIPPAYYQVISYLVHWYKRSGVAGSYIYTALPAWFHLYTNLWPVATILGPLTLTGTNITDSYVVLLTATTNSKDCYGGLPSRVPTSGPGVPYTQNELNAQSCNIFYITPTHG